MAAIRVVNAMFGRNLGGIEQALVDYSEALRLAGYEPHAIIHPKAGIREALATQDVHVHAIGNRGAWDPWAMYRIKRLMTRLQPALCIAHGNRAVSLLKHAGNAPVAAVAHNYTIRLQDVNVFCPTAHLMRHARAQGVPPGRLFHVPNMVRMLPLDAHPDRRSPPVIGAMGRWVAKKGFALFIEALSLLRARGVAFRAILAGDGEEAPALHALVREKGLEGSVSLPGWVADTKAFFAGIDLFCLPSLHEPFGIVLLEAMWQGLPVVATDSEGPGEILTHGTDGILVPRGDAIALADALEKVLADPALAAALGRNAVETVRRHYDLTVVSAKLDLAVRAAGRL